MRTSLNKIATAEEYLQGKMSPNDALLFKAETLIDPALEENVSAQQQAYTFIKQYGRRQLKAELETIHQKLFTETRFSAFARKVKGLFKA